MPNLSLPGALPFRAKKHPKQPKTYMFLELLQSRAEYGGIAQLGERLNVIHALYGSNPHISTIKNTDFSVKSRCFSILFLIIGHGFKQGHSFVQAKSTFDFHYSLHRHRPMLSRKTNSAWICCSDRGLVRPGCIFSKSWYIKYSPKATAWLCKVARDGTV